MKKQIINDTISDLVSDLLYYNRKEDEQLPLNAIEQAIVDGEISISDMIDTFRIELTRGIESTIKRGL